MKKRVIGYTAWLLLAACLYFFENNTGTRIVLLCSLLMPFVPPLRRAFFTPDVPTKEEAWEGLTARTFSQAETEETGEIRLYIPGDPIRRIHWKLSAKKDELLVRDAAAGMESSETKEKTVVRERQKGKVSGRQLANALGAGLLLCLALLLLIPEANRGARELCNRLFSASEAVNSYVYSRFTVPGNQTVIPASILLMCALILLLGLTVVRGSRALALGIMAGCTLFQVYFGLAIPSWISVPLYSLFAIWLLRRPAGRNPFLACGALILLVTVSVVTFCPGVHAATETASEKVRDRLTQAVEQITGVVTEIPGGETETRHIHPRSMESGDGEAGTEQEFRLVTVEEEQISMPHWINWMKVVLYLVLAVALVTIPFAPFLLLNARKKQAQENRKTFESENTGEAIRAIFRQVIRWLEATDQGEGNLLFREWAGLLPDIFPEGYTERFARCAADYEEAIYSDHPMPEQKRQNAMNLLKETEGAVWKAANRKQRLYLKWWMCLYE